MAPQPVTALRHHHEYAAKVVCGVVKEEKGPLNVGRYFTAVNVHNPSTKEARLCVKLAIASPGHGGNITKFPDRRNQPRSRTPSAGPTSYRWPLSCVR